MSCLIIIFMDFSNAIVRKKKKVTRAIILILTSNTNTMRHLNSNNQSFVLNDSHMLSNEILSDLVTLRFSKEVLYLVKH